MPVLCKRLQPKMNDSASCGDDQNLFSPVKNFQIFFPIQGVSLKGEMLKRKCRCSADGR